MGVLDARTVAAERIRIEVRSTATLALLDYTDVIAAPTEKLTRRVLDILAHADVTHGQRTYAILRDDRGHTVQPTFWHMYSHGDRSR